MSDQLELAKALFVAAYTRNRNDSVKPEKIANDAFDQAAEFYKVAHERFPERPSPEVRHATTA